MNINKVPDKQLEDRFKFKLDDYFYVKGSCSCVGRIARVYNQRLVLDPHTRFYTDTEGIASNKPTLCRWFRSGSLCYKNAIKINKQQVSFISIFMEHKDDPKDN